MEATPKTARNITAPFNKLFYALFVLLAGYFLIVNQDYGVAMSNLGIALIFDPFNEKVSFPKRPLYQRIWLLTHLVLVFILLGMELFY